MEKKEIKNIKNLEPKFEVNSFTFYRDYYNLINTLSLKDKSILAVAILDYVFSNEIPKLNGHNQAIMHTLIKQLDKSKHRSKSSQSIKNNTANDITKETTNDTTNDTTKEITNDITKGVRNNTFMFYVSNFILETNYSIRLETVLKDWLNYKKERKDKYTEIGFKKLLSRIKNNVEKYGEEKVISLIEECMANNYKGIIFEKLAKEPRITKKEQPTPNWLDKNIAKEEISEEEEQELKKLLNENI